MRADRQRNDDAIIRAAARLLAVDPAASTQAIADAAGVARLTLYRSFPTREALEGGVRAAVGARVNAALGAFAGWESGTEALRALVGALVLVGVTYPVALLRHRVAVDPGPFDTRMITLFRDGQRAGVLREDVPAETLNAALFAVLFRRLRLDDDGVAGAGGRDGRGSGPARRCRDSCRQSCGGLVVGSRLSAISGEPPASDLEHPRCYEPVPAVPGQVVTCAERITT